MEAWERNYMTEFYRLLNRNHIGPSKRKKEADEFVNMLEKKCNSRMICNPLSTVENKEEIQDITKSMKNRIACGDDG